MHNSEFKREFNRNYNEMRHVNVKKDYMLFSDGSCLICYGETKVICSAYIEQKVPRWLKGKGMGWITAEYSMLPTSTHIRSEREAVRGKQNGRTQEIQRLIGRSLRTICNLKYLGERQIRIDCDVICADGGTRTASITGSWIALKLAIEKLLSKNIIKRNPINFKVAAISCGIINNNVIVDLDYSEDSNATVDANFVFTDNLDLVEVQCSGEKHSFKQKDLFKMIELAQSSCKKLFEIQSKP